MALPPSPCVLVDANVLYSAALRDILIELADTDVIRLHWSNQILSEMKTALIRTGRSTEQAASRLLVLMNAALPSAAVDVSDAIVAVRLPDPKDAHVLIAALIAECTLILTFNVGDFPDDDLAQYGTLRALHPDTFFATLLAVDPGPLVAALSRVRERLQRPPLTAEAYLAHLSDLGLARTSLALKAYTSVI